ncbi:MAG: LamG-like jellyroll fold domain-containing protein, partial [Bacteroidota bacterium]
LLDNQDFESAQYYSEPQYATYSGLLEGMEVGSLVLGDEYTVGSSNSTSEGILALENKRGRSQFIYTAEELSNAGMTSGDYRQLSFLMNGINGSAEAVFLRLAWIEEVPEGDEFIEEGLEDVFSWNTEYYQDGWTEMNFLTTSNWDGESHLLVDLSYFSENALGNIGMEGDDQLTSLVTAEKESYLRMDWHDEVKVPVSTFEDVQDEITIEFWVRGDADVQPQASTIFEGVDSNNNRQLNSHLPWDNGRVYWDAGYDGGYDRIDQQASSSDFEGVWNHWAFVKNVAEGTMKMYLNGELWHSGTGKDNPIGDISKFSISSATAWSNFYTGDIDEFRIWSAELSEETIAANMRNTPTMDHPNFDALELRYDFNEGYSTTVEDKSGNERHGTLHGSPTRMNYHPKDYHLNPITLGFRPSIKVAQAVSLGSYQFMFFDYSEPVEASVLTEWEVDGNEAVLTESNLAWTSFYIYQYDPSGELVDSTAIGVPPSEVTNSILNYYSAPFEVVDRYELGRFITPYGINLDLEDGWTWVFDVTDYAPLLQGEVELECGNWQELLDLKFLFIEGTPPRDVQRVEAFWKGQHQLSSWDETVLPHTFNVEDGEETFRLKTRTSGHFFGQGNNCAEFCNNTHAVSVNGSEQWSWEIMQDCADNPLYPQGGTWVYDRAGWCPGAPTKTRDFELTNLVAGQDDFTVEYDIDYDPYGNYRFEGQIIAYGPINHANDVEISDVLAPSNMKVKSRMNPICNRPMIRIRNNGSLPLTSCTISYGINGNMESMQWTGNLAFMESEDVELNYLNQAMWDGGIEDELLVFTVTVDLPNGNADENPSNNTGTSTFVRPPVYDYGSGEDDNNELIIWTRTNLAYWETEVSIEDMDGNLMYLRNNFPEANTIYRDTIALSGGCYKFHLK